MSQKPQIILTDSSDLGEHISKLGDKIIDVMNLVADDKSTKEQIDRINEMTAEFRQLVNAVTKENREQADRVVEVIKDLRELFKKKTLVVPAPNVSVSGRELDLSPILKALKALQPKAGVKTFNLSDYRATELDNGPDKNQYLLFEDGNDAWYILRHDPETNQSRYIFGKGDHAQAWDERYSLDYLSMNEAKRALSA
jgi:hypothetical protein